MARSSRRGGRAIVWVERKRGWTRTPSRATDGGDQPISWLMFFTFAAVIFAIAGGFIRFLHSRRNRDIASNALAGNGSGRGAEADGALPDLIGIVVFAFIAMGLLTVGYKSKPYVEQKQNPPMPVGQTTR